MANENYDLSDLGATKSDKKYDLSDLGGSKIEKTEKGKKQSFLFPNPNDLNEAEKKFHEISKNVFKGFSQGTENIPIGYANLLPGVNIQKANWAGDNEDVRSGEMAAEIGSYFLPGGVFKGLKAIPYIGNALKSAVAGLEMKPIVNSLVKLGTATGSGALSSAALAPTKEEQSGNALVGGGIGGGLNLASQALFSSNPLTKALMKPLKEINKILGLGGNAGHETLEHINEEQVKPVLESANRLNTPITPAEASGNPFVGAKEGKYSRTSEAAALKTKIGMERVEKEKEAIKDLLDTIYDKSTPEAKAVSKEKISKLYEKANKWSLKPEIVEEFKKDPVIEAAFKEVEKDPAYRRKLQGIPENNYAYLNQVKRALNDMEGKALKAGEKDRASEFKSARNDLINEMDKGVPVYGKARQEAQKGIVRNKIEKAMSKKEIKGSTFFKTLLKNDEDYNKLRESLKNVPEAQDKLDDMRLAWKNLIDLQKPKDSAFRAETGLSQSRSWASVIVDVLHELTGSQRNIKALKFIHSPDWDKAFSKIQFIKDDGKRNEELANLLSKLVTGGTVSKSQGSDNNEHIL